MLRLTFINIKGRCSASVWPERNTDNIPGKARTCSSITVGAGFAPFFTLGTAKVVSLPAIALFLANPLGAVVVTGALAVGGAILVNKTIGSITKRPRVQQQSAASVFLAGDSFYQYKSCPEVRVRVLFLLLKLCRSEGLPGRQATQPVSVKLSH